MTDARRVAHDVLVRVECDQAYSHLALSAALDAAQLSAVERGLCTQIVYGTLTWRRVIDAELNQVLKQGIASVKPPLLQLLRAGAFQLLFLDRVPAHAVVDEAVKLAREVGGERSTGLVNAVLRRIEAPPRCWAGLEDTKSTARRLGIRWSLPTWLAGRLVQQFGDDRAEAIARASAAAPPIWIREVRDPDGRAQRVPAVDAALKARLDSGEVVIQDLGSQLVVRFGGPYDDAHVLDACAGLGGKALFIGETAASVLAVDPQASKLDLLRSSAERVELDGVVGTHEGTVQDLVDAKPFDVVLVDAPCSGLGVIRRHPEARWNKDEADIASLADQQAEILDAVAPKVAPGGLLVYSVCTFTPEETTRQVERFLARHTGFTREPPTGEWDGRLSSLGDLELMPDRHDSDGFYAARLRRGANEVE